MDSTHTRRGCSPKHLFSFLSVVTDEDEGKKLNRGVAKKRGPVRLNRLHNAAYDAEVVASANDNVIT